MYQQFWDAPLLYSISKNHLDFYYWTRLYLLDKNREEGKEKVNHKEDGFLPSKTHMQNWNHILNKYYKMHGYNKKAIQVKREKDEILKVVRYTMLDLISKGF